MSVFIEGKQKGFLSNVGAVPFDKGQNSWLSKTGKREEEKNTTSKDHQKRIFKLTFIPAIPSSFL